MDTWHENRVSANRRLIAFSSRTEYLRKLWEMQDCWSYAKGKEWQWFTSGPHKGQPLDRGIARKYRLYVHLLTS